MQAHQRIIREKLTESDPRESVRSLAGYTVELVSELQAKKIILVYEWLGNMGRSTVFVGLLSPQRDIHGVVCFGYGPGGNVRNIIGEPALCLERGACVHYAPPNAASFLINAACKLVCSKTGVAIFYAYADPMAGEYGAVYQASSWTYLGQGLGPKNGRPKRYFVLAPGKDPEIATNWQTSRAIYGRGLTFEQARALGWRIPKLSDPDARAGKHVYATNVGHGRKAWRKKLGAHLPYPNPRPELKLNGKEIQP